jgi:hypothetical protein
MTNYTKCYSGIHYGTKSAIVGALHCDLKATKWLI